ncbi:MAG: hypothetical protein ABFD29_07675 [Anaerolineaceae bacterium]
MAFPTLVFGIIVGALLGAIFHFWKGGSLMRLIYYLVVSEVGFWLGTLLGTKLNWDFIQVGALNIGAGILGSVLLLGFGYWLSLMQSTENK